MRSIILNKYLVLISRFIVGIVFIIASIDKIAVPELFAINIEGYNILPTSFINITAIIIPWIELLCGIFLISGFYLRSSSFIVSIFLVLFILMITSAILRGLHIDCGCFGLDSSEVSWYRVLEDIFLLLMTIHIYYYSTKIEDLRPLKSGT